ncbi:MAG TPA: glycosyltransferase family 2 protein, partial [Polyangiaceae bacterium]|nr:glycosyltransferase family 2 protein [Polyangiaceae bacterium]
MVEFPPPSNGTSDTPGVNVTNGEAPLRLSVVIANYNYGEFIGEAIDSALAIDWPDVEVIVVDDGSTDNSRRVIEGYGERIVPIFQPNRGQITACNKGFARSRGDVVIFLDSDDRLDPSLMRELAPVWRPGVSKVQFQMQIIDVAGRPTGARLPQYKVPPTPEKVRRWARTAAAYPTPPGSGNAYSRRALERIFPLEGNDKFSDSYCLAAAPHLGDIVTIPKPLVCYRVHGRNVGAMSKMEVTRLRREVTRAEWRFRYAQRLAAADGQPIPDATLDNSLNALAYRLS